jgi:carboxyl-terminal processing protease
MPKNASWRCASALALLLVLAPAAAAGQKSTRSAYEELQTFSGVLNHIRLNYPDSVGYSELVAAAIRGVLRSLDPHSRYVSRLDWERQSALERGELSTVGIVLEDVEGATTVLTVFPKSSAMKAGVLPGDRLVTLNDTSVAGLDAGTLEVRLAGQKGSKVRVRFERGPRLEPDTFSVTLKREPLEQRSVSIWRMVDSVTGYVRLEQFLGDASRELRDAIGKLRGQKARQVILDLRGNPGGSVVAAVEVASEFFPKNTVVFRTRGRKRDVDTTYTTKRDGAFREMPLIVLQDERSASASEALAGSLQDHDRALIVGRRSFGKALMQTLFFLPGGDNVWLTVGRVLTPNGRFIQRRYRGVGYEQYLSFAGKSGAEEDTSMVFHTDRGRPVRGGGGVVPDVLIPLTAPLPVWWSAASDSGLDHAVADSFAYTLDASPAARAEWLRSPDEWQRRLVPPFLDRVRTRFAVQARPDTALEARLGRILASRAAEVRWGVDARDEFFVRADPVVQTALTYFPRLVGLLAAPSTAR